MITTGKRLKRFMHFKNINVSKIKKIATNESTEQHYIVYIMYT